MSAIINLYVVPPPGATPDALGPLVRRLVGEAWVELPAVAGSPFMERSQSVVRSPQAITVPGRDAVRPVVDLAALEAELIRAATEPVLVAFAALNEEHPHVGDEFPHYRGSDCAVGFYAFPAGYRLRLVNEDSGGGDEQAALDRTVRCWFQLSGKAGIWESLFRGSSLERVLQAVWPGHEAVENDWL